MFLGVVVAALVAIAVVRGLRDSQGDGEQELPFSAFLQMVEKAPSRIKQGSLLIQLNTRDDADFRGELSDGGRFVTTGYLRADVLPRLAEAGIAYQIVRLNEPRAWRGVLVAILPAVALVVVVWFLLRRVGSGGGLANFRRSKARRITNTGKKVTFADVAGHRRGQGRGRGDHRLPG